MTRHCAFGLFLVAVCGCSIISQEPRQDDPPPAPVRQETHAAAAPQPAHAAEPVAADAEWVKWDMEQLMPKCPHCGAEVKKLRNSICSECYTRFRWHDVPVEDTPRGAFDKLKVAEIYNDLQTFRECVCLSDMKQIERTLGDRTDPDRPSLLEPQVVDEQESDDRATLTIVQHGQQARLHLAREGGFWKISLGSLRDDVKVDQARALVTDIGRALAVYVAEHGAPPPRDRWVQELKRADSAGKPYLSLEGVQTTQEVRSYDHDYKWGSDFKPTSRVADPWGHDVIYRPDESDGRHPFLVYSVGPDGHDDRGTGDDILPQ